MRKIFLCLLTVSYVMAFGQGNSLYSVSMIKPKTGQFTAFENAWKAHVTKYHNGDDKRMVYEVLTGDNAGYFHLVHGPSSFADFDKENPKKAAHDMDFESTVASKVAEESGSYVYRMVDTLSYNTTVNTNKYVFTVYNLKTGKMSELMSEIKRALEVNKSIQSPSSYTTYVRQMSGSSPQLVIITNLKDGFKQMEMNYFTGLSDKFKDAYIKMHSQGAWDKRQTLLQEITNSYETFLVKRRDDLSSK